MQQTKIFLTATKILVAFLFVMSITACQSGQKKDGKNIGIEDFLSDDKIFDDIDKAKKIIYSLPSPIETAMIIKSAGAEYDQELLNSLGNVENYTTNKELALNLGVYTTDLSFASLFEQTQTSIDYMNASKKMAEGLDITDVIDDESMKRLEANLNNRDVVMDIISETFLNSSADLKENQRQDVAAIVLVGGWIEGLYIASELVGNKSIENNKLVDRILEQKLSFNIVQRLLEDNKEKPTGEQNSDIIDLIAALDGIKNAFDKVSVETTEPTVSGQDEAGVSQIASKTTVSVKPEDFKTLQFEIKKLRTSFIQ
ncbi:MAG: hypothetical protein JXB34_06090 [Bacteroidales bacterium]|nr:hypothetical protein [Bacteroidales bacterium]